MRNFKYQFLEWAVGIFCVAVGAMMLIVPHQFNTPSYAMLYPVLAVWGLSFTAAGVFLLGVGIFTPRLPIVMTAHIFAGGLLLLLALGFTQVQALSGITHYTVLGLGTLIAPLITRPRPDSEYPQGHPRDLFGVIFSLAAAVSGAMICLFPDLYNATIIAAIRPLLPGMGLAFFSVGVFGLIAQFYPRTSDGLYRAAMALLGLVYFTWFIQIAMPIRALTGYPYYGGMGILLIASPWVQGRVYRLRNDPLQIRFALLLAILTAIPMMILTSLTSESQRVAAIDQALNSEQDTASLQGQYVASIVSIYESVTESLAAQPGLLQMSHEQQEQLVKTLKQSYPDVNVFGIRDASNNVLVRSDGVTTISNQPLSDSIYDEIRTTNQPVIRVAMGVVYNRQFIVVASPIKDSQGNFAGYVTTSIDVASLSNLLSRADSGKGTTYLVDSTGRALIHPDDVIAQSSADLSKLPLVASLLASSDPSGSLIYSTPQGQQMVAGFARVPELGWGVVVERTEASILSAIQLGRELSLVLLIVVCGVALMIGTGLARTLIAPLWKVSSAMNQLNADSPQPIQVSSNIAEVSLLVDAFNHLRERLVSRTEERDAAEKRLMYLAEATDVLNASLNYEETLRAIAKLAVPKLGDWCTIDVVDENHELQQVAVVHSDPELETLVAEWRKEALKVPHDVDLGRDVLRTGQPILVPEIPESMVKGVASGDEQTLKLMSALNLISALCVPLVVRGERIGVIFLNTTRESGRRLTNDDMLLLSELARRASTAIDNAKLYREAQQAVALRDEFLSVAAHELKTPVTSVRGFAQTTLRQFEKQTTPDLNRINSSLQRIDQQSEKLGRLISQLLDVSRIMGGKLAIEPEQIELVALVKNIAADAQLGTQRHNIHVTGVPEAHVQADPLRIEQVVTNLVNNAIKYSPDGGPIIIKIIVQPDGTVCISVTDRGLGIPEQDRSHIFNRFFQAHRDGYYGGMGLGLFISKQIMELHSGRLEVDFPVEGGTRFTMSLPAVPVQPMQENYSRTMQG